MAPTNPGCPHGGTFGVDIHALDECDKCDVSEDCDQKKRHPIKDSFASAVSGAAPSVAQPTPKGETVDTESSYDEPPDEDLENYARRHPLCNVIRDFCPCVACPIPTSATMKECIDCEAAKDECVKCNLVIDKLIYDFNKPLPEFDEDGGEQDQRVSRRLVKAVGGGDAALIVRFIHYRLCEFKDKKTGALVRKCVTDDDGRRWIEQLSIATIANETGLKKKTVGHALRVLVKRGLVDKIKNPHIDNKGDAYSIDYWRLQHARAAKRRKKVIDI